MLGRIFTKEYMYIEKNIFPKNHVARKALTCVEESSGTYASCYLLSSGQFLAKTSQLKNVYFTILWVY